MTDKIEVFTQSSIRVETGKGNVYFDPFHMTFEPHDADFIFVTHDHYDHFSPEDIRKVSCGKTVLVVPEKMKAEAGQAAGFVKEIVTVTPGISTEIGGLQFETVAAYNKMKPFHPKSAGWVGYILNVDGKRIYVSGDTDATKEAESVRCDVALVPIGGTYTMDAKKAAELINTIRPEIAIPTHYGSIVGSLSDGDTFAELVKPPVTVELKLKG